MDDEAREGACGGAACPALFLGCGSDARCHPHCESEDEPAIAPQPENGKAAKLVKHACNRAKMAESTKLSCWPFLMILLAICHFLIILQLLFEKPLT